MTIHFRRADRWIHIPARIKVAEILTPQKQVVFFVLFTSALRYFVSKQHVVLWHQL